MTIRPYAAVFAAACLSACASQTPTPTVARQAMPVYSTPQAITQRCDQAIKNATALAQSLAAIPLSDITEQSFLEPWDTSGAATENALGPIYLQAYVHPDADIRDAGERCILEVGKFRTELFQNENLYQRLKTLKLPANANPASQQLQDDLLQAFEKSGVTLPPEQRKTAADISEKIERLAQEFQRHLRDNNDAIFFSTVEVDGMPESWKASHKEPDGRYRAGFDYPDYFPFMRNAKNEAARKRFYYEFSRRGGAENLVLLDQIVALRQQLAQLHKQASFAHMATQNRMLNSPEKIQAFLTEVGDAVLTLEQQDIAELSAEKSAELAAGSKSKSSHASDFNRWDLPYYLEQTRKQRFDIDQETLRQYFPTAATVQWALNINQQLFGIRIQAAAAQTWHDAVEYYDVFDASSNDYLGAIYLDLYPRDGKYKHAAAFPIRSGSQRLQQRPSSALVTNFNEQGLTQNEVETLMHELGHVFHGVLSQTWYASHSGTEVKRDFVEAPSQMLEAWAQRYETLSTVADFCDGCPRISEKMVEQLEAARTFGQGSFYARQHLYASYDMALAGGKSDSAQSLWAEMEGERQLGHLAGSQFPGTFGHIAGGYAAGYYGYLWSAVLALDMQSQFGDNLMNPELGKRYRTTVLEHGGDTNPAILVENFLGRKPNSKAFFEQFKQ